MAADLPRWSPCPVRRPSRRSAAPVRAVGRAASGVFAARLRPDRLVDARSPVQRARLAAGTAGLRRAAPDTLDPGGDVPAGFSGHGGGGGCSPRAWAPLCRRRRRRLGRRAAAARLDEGENREIAPAAAFQRDAARV